MQTSSQSRIEEYTAKGWWGQDTLHGMLRINASETPDRIAIADQPNRTELTGSDPLRLSFSALKIAADNLSEQLLAQGVQIDEKIIVQLPNITELVVFYYAASQIGAIVSPIPVLYGKHEIDDIVATLDASKLVTIDRFRDTALAKNALSSQCEVLSFGQALPDGVKQLAINTEVSENHLLEEHRANFSETVDDANNIFTICWTSGTTGSPKGVPRSHNMWFATAASEIEPCDFRQGDLLLNPFPLINMAALGGFLFPAAKTGSSLFLHHPLDPPLFLKQLQDEKITFTIAPPALLNQLAKVPDMWNQFDFSQLRRIGSGSAPLAEWMIETFSKEYGKEIINFYGSNEGISLLSTDQTSPQAEQRAKMFPRLGVVDFSQAGAMADFVKTKVADPDTGETIESVGQPGELLIDGPTVFDGYYNSARSSDVFTEDGFFRTGDLVEICPDENGDPGSFYKIVGRCKDIINRGGVKISPSEIDNLLEGHPDIAEVSVCAYADERLGERVCACVVSKDPENAPSLDSLIEFLEKFGVAKYKLPERIEYFEALPRNAMAKVLRFELQDLVSKRN